MSNIGIDYTSAVHQSAGIGRYTREMVKALAKADPQTAYHLFVADAGNNFTQPKPGPNFDWHPTRLTERWLARLWYRLRLPLPVETWTGPLKLFHQPDFILPPVRPGTRTLITVHDLSFERQPADTIMPGMERHLKKWVPASVKKADHVIAVSETTRQDLIELYQISPQKITTLYHGVTPEFKPVADMSQLSAVRQKYKLGSRPFVLSISTLQPRKNYRRLIQSFANLDNTYSLVIAGGKGWHYEDIFAEVAQLGLQDRVIFPGFIDDADLPALYTAADLFVYPSLYEGFGLPILEAMACGTPVIAANASSLPEVVGEAGLLVDPYNIEAMAAAIKNVLQNAALQNRLSQAGFEQAQKFTWEAMAAKLIRLYQTLLEE